MKLMLQSLLLLVGILLPATTFAQSGGRYTPARPTVSPYLNLLRRDSGPIPNYYSLVRPQQQQRVINQQQQAINLQQQSFLQTQQQDLQRVQQGILEVQQPQVSSTGTGGGFMNFAHFYSFPTNSRGLRR